jgi:hypothetical protein
VDDNNEAPNGRQRCAEVCVWFARSRRVLQESQVVGKLALCRILSDGDRMCSCKVEKAVSCAQGAMQPYQHKVETLFPEI